jgi:hypothetical protein
MTITQKLDEMKALGDSSTPGPWTEDDVRYLNRGWMTKPGCNDHAFIAASRQGWPQCIEALRIAVEALESYATADRVEVRREPESWPYDGHAIATGALRRIEDILHGK